MARLCLRVLGPFEASLDGAAVTSFRTDKMRALLAYLAVNADRPFRRETLAALLWPDWPDADARRNLRQTLHRLRQLLDEQIHGLGEDLLATTRQTVQLQGSTVDLDVAQFQAHLQFCDTHYHEQIQRCRECLEHMRAAAELYHGELLAGFAVKDAYTYDEWLYMQREQLQGQVLELLDTLAGAYEQQGDYALAQRYASQQVMMAPWRESAHRQLMRLYMLQGKRTAALAQYESARHMLDQELDVEPSPETEQLYHQIKDGRFQKETVTQTQIRHFPTQLTPFIGRERELAQILDSLSDPSCRILSLIGPGGTGKTRLSIQVGQVISQGQRVYRDGAYFIPLAAVSDLDALITATGQHLGLQFAGQTTPQQQLLNSLRDKEMLLVMDNFEQILPAAALLALIVQKAPQVQIMVTTREPLNIQGEWRQNVGGLDYSAGADSEAVIFFQRSARRVAPQFKPGAKDLEAILELCRLADGLPLALEIASSWVRMMDCSTILRETKKSLDFLASPLGDVLPRHQSIRAVLSQSWKQLTPHLQKSLTEMTLFAGSFTMPAALEVVPDLSMIDLATLLDKALLRWRPDGRYEMHELPRQFVRDQPQAPTAQQAFCQFYFNLVVQQEQDLRGEQPQKAIDAFQKELDNGRRSWHLALESGRADLLALGLNSIARFYHLIGLFNEARRGFLRALAIVQQWPETPLTMRLVCQLHLQCAHFLGQEGQYEAAMEQTQAGYDRAQELEDDALTARALSLAGEWRRHLGQFDKARRWLQDAAALFPDPAHNPDAAKNLNEMGFVQLKQSQYDAALESFTQAREIYAALEDQTEMSTTLGHIGYVFQLKGNFSAAAAHNREALDIAERIGYKQGIVRQRIGLGSVDLEQGNIDQARRHFEDALQIATVLGFVRGIITCQIYLGSIFVAQGKYAEAEHWYQRARRQAQEMHLQDLLATAVSKLGVIHAHRGEQQAALADYEEAGVLWRELNNQTELGRNQGNLANIYMRQGDYDLALQHYNEALLAVEASGSRPAVANTLVKMGNIYKRIGNYERAASFIEQAQQLYRELDLKSGLAVSTGWLGILDYEQGRFDAAVEKYAYARQLCEEIGDKLSMGVWITNLSDVALAQGDYDQAWEYNLKSYAIFREIDSGRFVAEGLVKQARIRFEQGRFEQARLRLAEGIQMAEPIGDKQILFDATILRARLAGAAGDRESAVSQLLDMLPDFTIAEYQAEIYYYLWQLSGQEQYREKAKGHYESLTAVTPNFIFRERLKSLQTVR